MKWKSIKYYEYMNFEGVQEEILTTLSESTPMHCIAIYFLVLYFSVNLLLNIYYLYLIFILKLLFKSSYYSIIIYVYIFTVQFQFTSVCICSTTAKTMINLAITLYRSLPSSYEFYLPGLHFYIINRLLLLFFNTC